eukprot:c9419_g1_i1.p1 GENE.c9419_g1_i1~~c9419_g1_i1.p1  ORF type:complete len:188 (+),score=31.06 c9419_g1_i1:293-856(+)
MAIVSFAHENTIASVLQSLDFLHFFQNSTATNNIFAFRAFCLPPYITKGNHISEMRKQRQLESNCVFFVDDSELNLASACEECVTVLSSGKGLTCAQIEFLRRLVLDDESAHAMPEASSIFRPYSHDFPMSLSNLTSSKHNSSHSSSLLDSSNMSNSSDLSNSSSTNSNISNVMHTNNGVIESILPV